MNHPKISIIIPNYNGKQDVLTCLRSLSQLSYPQEKIKLIMVDNASNDGSIEAVKKKYPQVKIIALKKNLGFSRGVNQGLRKASGDYLFVINNDIIFDKNFITVLVDYMEKRPKIGVAGGKIYYQKPKNKILFSGIKFNPWTGSITLLPNPNQIKESEWIQGCAMLIKRKVVEKIGLFDPGFFIYNEDQDFCLRARKAGFKIIYHPQAIAWHKEGGLMDRIGFRKKALTLYQSKFRYVFKNCSFPQIISITLVQFFLVAPYRKLVLKDRYFFLRPMFWGFYDNLKQLPQIRWQKKKS